MDASNFALYSKLGDRLSQANRQHYVEQLERTEIAHQDPSHTEFRVLPSAPAVDDKAFDQTLDAFYDDEDGDAVCLIIHFVDGYISWAERFRLDRQLPKKLMPDPSEVRWEWIVGGH